MTWALMFNADTLLHMAAWVGFCLAVAIIVVAILAHGEES